MSLTHFQITFEQWLSEHYDPTIFERTVRNHFLKQGVDVTVFDLRFLNPQQQENAQGVIERVIEQLLREGRENAMTDYMVFD